MRRTTLCVALLTMSVAGLAGQAPAPPKPGPEHQRLGAFVGNWTFVGEMKAGPMGPGGKMTGSDRIQWIANNFAVERRFDGKGPMGTISGLEIITYDTTKKIHSFSYVDSTGAIGSGTATISGSTWTFNGMASTGGQTLHDRCRLTFGTGNTTLKIACEASQDGKKWAPSFDGTATKAK